MLLITDKLSFKGLIKTTDINISIQSINGSRIDQLKERVSTLLKQTESGYKSLLTLKSNEHIYTESLGIEVKKFNSKVFTIDDFLTISKSNTIIYSEVNKDTKERVWYFINQI